ncbi:MAG: hypothetical protein JW993_04035 [Sedimentisphaerales bacterium]|nr:hypothetical protein [Sedimentisphaerales bacterium]
MDTRLETMRQSVRDGDHKQWRRQITVDIVPECERENLSWVRRSARLTRRMCEAEQVVIGPTERIVFTRTIPVVPSLYSPSAWRAVTAGRKLHEMGPISNICADWRMVLEQGLLGRRAAAQAAREKFAADPQSVEFLDAAIETIDAVLALADRYARTARERGRDDLAAILQHVPGRRPRSFHEALQCLRLCHAVLWMSGHYHCGLGRFDQYMWPYLQADLESGRLDEPEAEALLAEFFITLNKDSDLYPGVQQGDNGQSLMLGGVRRDGSCGVNRLTYMALRAALDVSMIDPKINLRVTPDTDMCLLELAAKLTQRGLGFPQYSNDDVVIPGLVRHGYDLEDARDYSVAACWEYIIPGKGMDVVNIGAVSMPAAVHRGIVQGLRDGADFDAVLKCAADDISAQVKAVANTYHDLLLPPAPYYSVLMDGCLERGRDLSHGLRYNNYGVHGAASSSAADALAAVKRMVFDRNEVSGAELLEALDRDYDGFETLQSRLRTEAPKVGNHDDMVDSLLVWLFEQFAQACESYGDNGRGGLLRPGSGSAMYYVWLAQGHQGMSEPVVGATADGRRRGEYFSSNLAPSAGVRVRGPISVLQTYSKLDYSRICNGGPVTIELADSVFRDAGAIRRVAMLIRTFAQLGCQQLQLNTLNVETLEDAKRHPERHKNLIVRVWGWSGYFCELAPEYQDQIVERHVYALGEPVIPVQVKEITRHESKTRIDATGCLPVVPDRLQRPDGTY